MYYFIVNPGSRSGRGKAVWQIVEGILERDQVESCDSRRRRYGE